MLAKSVGAGVGYLFTLFFVTIDEDSDVDVAKEQVLNLCVIVASSFTVISFFCVLFFREKPPMPPTYSISQTIDGQPFKSLRSR